MAKAAQKPITADDPELWAKHLAVHKARLGRGDPKGLKRVQDEIAKLNWQISALANRRELAARGVIKVVDTAFAEIDRQVVLEVTLTRQIEERAAKVKDLTMLTKGLKRVEKDEETGPTVEAEMKPSRIDPIDGLETNGTITPEQATAARTIARIMESISRAGQAKVGKLEGGGSGAGYYREPEMPEELDALRHAIFLPWADQLKQHGPVSLDIAVKVSVYGIALDRIRRKHKIGWDGALAKLRDALDLFNRLARDHRKQCSDEGQGTAS
jgi:hypothetical protein